MKNLTKILGIITLATALVCALVSCGDGGGGSGGGSGGGNNGPPNVIYLKAGRWDDDPNDNNANRGENWSSGNQIKLSDFTTVKPKQGDILTFKISGVSDKEIKYCRFEIYQITGSTYKWLGTSLNSKEFVVLPYNFNDYIYVQIYDNPNPNSVFYVDFKNFLWWKMWGDYRSNSGETLPANIPNNTIMATIHNFKISLDSVENSGLLFYNDNNEIIFFALDGISGNVTIPSQKYGKPITRILGNAFENHPTGLTGITIPNSITSIEDNAFSGCTSLTSVTFQGTITTANFGSSAFNGDLRTKYLAGGIGTYTRPSGSSTTWTKK